MMKRPGWQLTGIAWVAVCVLPLARGAVAAALTAPAASTVCQSCHGAGGEGNAPAGIPRIAGQTSEYLEKELADYSSGSRANPIMQNFAKALSDSDRKAVAEYFASLDTPYAVTKTLPNATQLARGHQLARQGVEALRVQACNNCRGPEGIGVPHAAPYLAGQSPEYISSAIKSFINGTRKNDPGKLMSTVAERLDDADIAAVAAYFATVGVGSNP